MRAEKPRAPPTPRGLPASEWPPTLWTGDGGSGRKARSGRRRRGVVKRPAVHFEPGLEPVELDLDRVGAGAARSAPPAHRHARLEQRRRGLSQVGVRFYELFERDPPLHCVVDHRSHDPVSLAERHSTLTSHSARSVAAAAGPSAALRIRSRSKVTVSRSPPSAGSASPTWSIASKSGSLSSCRSRL